MVLRNHSDIKLKGSFGQYILNNETVLQAIVHQAGVRNSDVVLEIGPGTGNLTIKLLQKAKRVIAVELDSRMVFDLRRRVQGTPYAKNLTIIHGNAIKVDLPSFNICVANIPYQISSPLTFKLLIHRPFFRAAVMLYQLEFAMHLIAKPGCPYYGRLSVNTQSLSRVTHLLNVGRNNFRPVPKVDSSILRIEPRNPPPQINFVEWDGLTRLCFRRKNKTLRAIFQHNATLSILKQNYIRHHFNTIGDTLTSMSALRGIFQTMPLKFGFGTELDNGEKRKPAKEFEAIVTSVLRNHGFDKKRSSKIGQHDMLKLLSAMNTRGIHFG
jgi:18S rRNA (adenine1779-N6/adenine1780-N6)-dimethyltransferase